MSDNREDLVRVERAAEVSRRGFLRKALVGVAAAGGGGLVAAGQATAAPKMSKAAALYQDHPKNGQRCGNCNHFFLGGCEVVAGLVSFQGWCKLYKAS